MVVTLFYVLTPFCVLGILETGVSLKYEVDQAVIFVEIDEKMTVVEKEQALKDIGHHRKELTRKLGLWTIAFFIFPLIATSLLIFRKQITGSVELCRNV